jgi:hypothetical protein
MTDFIPPDLAIGGLIVAAAVLYAAWYEYARNNRRDAGLLAATGALSLMGSAAVWAL